MVKDPKLKGKSTSPALSRTTLLPLLIAALIALAVLTAICGWLLFRQRTLLDREDGLEQETVRLEQELVDRRLDCERQQEELEDQRARLEDQRARLEDQRVRLEQQQAQLEQAQDTIDQLSHTKPALPDGEVPEYATLYPNFYAPRWTGETVTGGRVCFLTFDDGPSANTDRILETLDRYGVKATFFVVGKTGAADQERMRKIVAAGHTIGMHSWSHNYYQVYGSVEGFLEEFNQLYEWIYQVTGVYPTVFRFPGGSINGYNRGVYQEIIAEMTRRGFVYYDWNASAGDATSTPRDASAIAADCLKGIGKKLAVVLAHDSAARTTTADALPAVIEGYRAAGYTFSALHPGVTPVIYGYPKIE